MRVPAALKRDVDEAASKAQADGRSRRLTLHGLEEGSPVAPAVAAQPQDRADMQVICARTIPGEI
jgi:hypothetical protein